jgi:hypothetical protein
MRVIFSRSDDGRQCSWRAELPRHRRLEGSTMAARAGRTDLPHDLAQFVVESTLGLEEGFWNLVRSWSWSGRRGGSPPLAARPERADGAAPAAAHPVLTCPWPRVVPAS